MRGPARTGGLAPIGVGALRVVFGRRSDYGAERRLDPLGWQP